jgi:hypothetical protein
LILLPDSGNFAVRLRWSARQPTRADVVPDCGKVLQTVHWRNEAEEIVLICEPEVFGYRLR